MYPVRSAVLAVLLSCLVTSTAMARTALWIVMVTASSGRVKADSLTYLIN